jgi:hypothetical protein
MTVLLFVDTASWLDRAKGSEGAVCVKPLIGGELSAASRLTVADGFATEIGNGGGVVCMGTV